MNVVKDSEAELVLKLKNGSQTAFSLLYELHVKRIYTFALKILKSPALAEDIVQEVFVKLWETAPKLEPNLPLQSYLFTIARNLSLNVIRKAAKETIITEEIARYALDQGDDGLAFAQYRQTKEFVSRAVQLLPPQRRKIYELCHGSGYSYKQAAEELGLKDATINSQMVKAIRSIKRYLVRHGALLSLFF
ncbi:RNA polymerase sigma factor [Pedobacter sp. KBS0701]|uniref:RNA polymerase sigma factor n=1 Tax=unclassified Pedobacter TaxID=2628915 RepID=UPI00110D5C25|nr:sigma-70 family RNA polymerase sigma factor [Pedobacter sp. KBS0701]QDW23919.1 sigma-70 family RNA polymerase sigma factor [Pedobacter sp. KBS0701]